LPAAAVSYNLQPQNLFTRESIVAFFILMIKMFNLFAQPLVFHLQREYFSWHLTKNVSLILFKA
jgi:hypothetical protein